MDEIIQILSKNFLKNINLIYFIENYPAIESIRIGDSFLIKGYSDRKWMMFSCDNSDVLQELLRHVRTEEKCFAFVEDWMLPYISKDKSVKWQLTTTQYYLPSDAIVPSVDHEITNLHVRDAEFICKHSDYSEYLSVDYVKDRIQRGPSSAIYEDGNLAAWIHTHDDFAIGSLHVLPEFRRRGFALRLLSDMIYKVRSLNKIPFTYIEPANFKSINLVTKLNFLESKNISWLELI